MVGACILHGGHQRTVKYRNISLLLYISEVYYSNTKSVYPPFLVDIKALHAGNSELVSVAPKWMDLGLSLGLDKPVLDSLESNYPRDVNRCLTETLAKWLQQVRTARSWRTITHALIAPSINRADLAHSVATKHGMCQTGFVFCFCPFSLFFFCIYFSILCLLLSSRHRYTPRK